MSLDNRFYRFLSGSHYSAVVRVYCQSPRCSADLTNRRGFVSVSGALYCNMRDCLFDSVQEGKEKSVEGDFMSSEKIQAMIKWRKLERFSKLDDSV